MLVVVSLLAYNLCRQLNPLPTLVSHFSTEYRKTPLPADEKGSVREVQYQKDKRSYKETVELR